VGRELGSFPKCSKLHFVHLYDGHVFHQLAVLEEGCVWLHLNPNNLPLSLWSDALKNLVLRWKEHPQTNPEIDRKWTLTVLDAEKGAEIRQIPSWFESEKGLSNCKEVSLIPQVTKMQ
jgi:hypothetical protein